jgi:Iron-containing redox enzyme
VSAETMASSRPAAEWESGRGPALPERVGPLSAAVASLLLGQPTDGAATVALSQADPYGLDLHLALYLCYELHYRGLDRIADEMEWNLDVIGLRVAMEEHFLQALRAEVPGGDDLDAEVSALVSEPAVGRGISYHLAADGSFWQLREYIALRSLYHLKEADPQAWVIPRLHGPAKAAIVSVEHDEYGGGRAERMHSHLFAEMMRELNLCPSYGAYLGSAPATVLAEVNLMSLCGLRRRLRGASIGQFAVIELTSSPGSARLVRAAQRLGVGPATERFYAEHVEADAVHEQVLRRGVLAPLVQDEPAIASDIVFGIQASGLLAARFADDVLQAWSRDESALRTPLDESSYLTCRDDD